MNRRTPPRGPVAAAIDRLESRTLFAATGTVSTATSLVAASQAVTLGGNDAFTATVLPTAPGGATPTGTVEFFSYNGTYPTQTVPLSDNGTAILPISAAIPGFISYLAIYSGDATYAPSESPGVSTAVNADALVATLTHDTLPLTVVAGATAKGVVTVTLTNGSADRVSAGEKINVHALSYLGGASFSSAVVGSLSKKVTLAAGADKAFPIKVDLKSVDATAGSYFLAATVTDDLLQSSYASSKLAGSIDTAITVAPAVVSLSATVGIAAPTSVKAGKMVALKLIVTNAGNVDSSGLATITVALSADGTTATAPLSTLTKSIKVKSGGKAIAFTLRVKVPVTQPAGDFLPLVTFAQDNSAATAVGTTRVTIG